MKHLIAAAAALALAGCTHAAEPEPGVTADRPVFVQYRPEQAARYRLEAPYDGVLTQRGPCLGVVQDGRFSTLIWPETARIAFGADGLEVSEEGAAPVRLGDRIEFTGGPLPQGLRHELGGSVLSVDMPIECAKDLGYEGSIAIVNPGFRRRR